MKNVYTGAAACDTNGERLLVGDKVGSVHVWSLIDNEPKLVILQENILEVKFDYFFNKFYIFLLISIIRMILKRLYLLVKMHLFLLMEKVKLKSGMSI